MHKLRRFGFNAIKESFDRLPTAVCFFDRSGGIVLCNRQMYRLSQYLLNSDLQYLEELQKALASPPKGIMHLASPEDTYRFPDGLVWKFERAAVTDRYGETYMQLTAADVTALHRALEQLAAKSAMHDSLAACITVTKQYLAGDLGGIDADIVLREWKKSIVFQEAGLLAAREKLYESADSSGVTVRIRGAEPANGAADLMYAAMQVCLNNAIQYAQATELMANIWEDGDRYTVLIRNNGRPPEKTITEGGGLSNLRRRIERIGGTMTVQSLPEFALVIGIPNRGNLEEGNEWLSETY